MKDPVRRKIERYELTRTIDPEHFFPTVEAGVAAFRAEAANAGPPPTSRATRPDPTGDRGMDMGKKQRTTTTGATDRRCSQSSRRPFLDRRRPRRS